jgi:signal transduction histidine kinase
MFLGEIMNRKLISVVAVAASIMFPCLANAETPDEAKALTLKAADLLKDKGVDGAKDLLHADGEFKHGEMYVNVIDTSGTWLIYPPKPVGEGKSAIDFKDIDGHYIVKEILATAKDKGEGWVEYRWTNPATNQIQPKTTYVKNVPERGVVVYVGVYK